MDSLQDDTGLLRQRHEFATMEIQGADESILIRPGSGTAQGSEGAFHIVYHKRTDTWSGHLRADLLQEALIFKPPPAVPDLFNSPVFMGLTTYADDVRVTSITTEPVHTLSRVMANNACPGRCAGRDGTKHSEARTLCLLCGPTSQQHMASLNGSGVLPASTGPFARYLGPRNHEQHPTRT